MLERDSIRSLLSFFPVLRNREGTAMKLSISSLAALWLGLTFTVSAVCIGAESSEVEKTEKVPLLDHKMKSLDGEEVDLGELKGKVLLIVNVASKCGATPQYAGLQALQEKYAEEGLVLLGFPCNQFGGQEPGGKKEIMETCSDKYHVTFPMFEKIEVNGENACKLYKQLTSKEFSKDYAGPVKWNFEKFLIGRDGAVKARFATKVTPDAEDLVKAVEEALAEKTEESPAK